MAYSTKRKKRIVLASGVFDLLHLGHVRFLEEAKKAGGPNSELIVVVARDSTVERSKMGRPVMPENQRRALVESLKVVNRAILGLKRFNVGMVIEKLKPDVIALGYDQDSMAQAVTEYVEKNRLPIKIVRIGEFGQNELNSSSKIKRKILEDLKT